MTSLRSSLLRVLATLAPFLVALLLAEGALRILDYPRWPSATPQPQLFVEYDSLLGWRNIPSLTADYETQEYRTVLAYNRAGMRGPDRPYAKPAGTRRVLLIGDSFVDGYTVPAEHRVAEQLEELVGDSAAAETEVLAHGVKGHSTDQQLLWLQHEGLRYQPDVVVLMFYSNDVWYNAQSSSPDGIPKPVFDLIGDSLALRNVPVPQRDSSPAARRDFGGGSLLRATRWVRWNTKTGLLADRAIRRTPALSRLALRITGGGRGPDTNLPDETLVFRPDPPSQVRDAWTRTDALLRRMRDTVRASGGELRVFYVPHRAEVQPAQPISREPILHAGLDPRAVARELAVRCAALGIPFVDPVPEFRRALASEPGRAPLYFEYDWHWTARGHRLAAEALATHLANPQLASTSTVEPPIIR